MTIFMLVPGLETEVPSPGQSILVADITMGTKGGVIVNPLTPFDQGLYASTVAESLFVNLLGDATPNLTAPGTVELVPGQWFLVPPLSNVWVSAATAGHKFTAFFSSTYKPTYPPNVVPGQPVGPLGPGSDVSALGAEPGTPPFPPPGVTGLTTVIPSYLYQQYTDDDDLQGFVQVQNEMQQDYVDTFNALNLPIYTGPIVEGQLLDWVARGLYGISRPSLGSGLSNLFGPLNTWGCNWIAPMWFQYDKSMEVEFGLNEIALYGPFNVYVTDDDTFRRIISWHFFKADGRYCDINFMKRRIWRFLYCEDGKNTDWAWDPILRGPHPTGIADPDDAFIANTSQISILFGPNRNCTIRFVLGNRQVTLPAGGAMLNGFGCNGFEPAWGRAPPWDIGTDITTSPSGIKSPKGIYLNDLETTYEKLPPMPFMYIFKQALDLGVLETPYQFNFTCHIG